MLDDQDKGKATFMKFVCIFLIDFTGPFKFHVESLTNLEYLVIYSFFKN